MKLWFDGSSSSYGYVLDGLIVIEGQGSCDGTHNMAEYTALIEGLKKAIKLGYSKLDIMGDSQIVIHQLQGRAKCRASTLKPLYEEAKALLELMPSYTLTWIERKHNKADKISRPV